MCLIIVKPKDIELPSDYHIRVADSNNDDGIGVMVKFTDKARVFIKKDFKTAVEFTEWMKTNVKKEDIMVIHFRWATSGKNDMGNRHPFPITKNRELLRKTELFCGWAVVHNGVLTEYSGHKKYSDTQKFTLDILASQAIKDNLRDKTVQKMIESFIGSDKLAILNEDGTLIKIGNFTKDTDGCYYSNDTYKQVRVVYDYSNYHGYGGGGFGQRTYFSNGAIVPHNHYSLNQGTKGASSPGDDDDSPIVNQGSIFFDHCDGCGRKKKLLEIPSTHFDGEVFFLCKSCRKQYKKGKLDRLDEAIGENIEAVNTEREEKKKTGTKCDSCLEEHEIEDMVRHGDLFYCVDCCEDWKAQTNAFNKAAANNPSQAYLNLEQAEGGYCA
jgi:predicted glutamine amidotransferase